MESIEVMVPGMKKHGIVLMMSMSKFFKEKIGLIFEKPELYLGKNTFPSRVVKWEFTFKFVAHEKRKAVKFLASVSFFQPQFKIYIFFKVFCFCKSHFKPNKLPF